ncbi:hypothetical protein [Rhodanobacter sp. Root561]|uniref:hypothetical protein n=1 Tax=Rhodanobacter sp. Root561 TaxID=1736560 RepID=UPI000AFB3A32|nr:hypothetical protein [Rhodanobacter sp. Root561]
MAGLAPEHVAFLGECVAHNVYVQMLCWSETPTAWSMLAEAAAAMRMVRDGSSMSHPVGSLSWVQRVAPQLSEPLERERDAAESTLATMIGRLPVRFAMAVVEHERGERQGTEGARYRSLFSGCLTAYDTYLKSSGQHSVRIMIAPSQGDAKNDLRLAVYRDLLRHLDGTERRDTLELAFWPEGTPPLAMEVAQLAAAAVSRHLQEPTLVNPLFETVRTHLAPPSHFHALGGRTGRR